MFLFVDDNSGFSSGLLRRQDIFAMGGLLISKSNMKEVEKDFIEIKKNFGLPEVAPVKWNFKDNKIKKFFEKNKLMKAHVELLERMPQFRNEVFDLLCKYNISLIFSCFRRVPKAQYRSSEFYQCALTNILQRCFFDGTPINIILDWDENNKDNLFRSFLYPYYRNKGVLGESFYDCCLNNIKNGYPFISFSITRYNPFLQLADMAVGCCGAFVEAVIKDKEENNLFDNFRKLFPSIRGHKSKNIFTHGFILSHNDDKIKIINKISEMGM